MLTFLGTQAQESGAQQQGKPRQDAVEERPFDAAKRQFQVSEQQQKPYADQARKDLPTGSGALQNTLTSPVYNLLNQNRLLAPKSKGGENWLIQGVQKAAEKDKKASGAKTNASAIPLPSGKDETTDQTLVATLPGEDSDSKGGMNSGFPPPRLSKPEVDPLLPFMEKWMSAKDYDLLVKPSLAAPGQNGVISYSSSAYDTFASQSKGNDEARPPLPPPTDPLATENPFLKSLGDWSAPSMTPAASSPAVTFPLPTDKDRFNTQQEPAEKSSAKDLRTQLKQSDDRKYFPQLKRF